eukprot:TRINITY_DN6621_c0_g2_i1.p1 TRINITY_DN6621_c0_g2~~TRINITY_DN6621_c0_g2_i1.p1  ORF type:complete len:492 (+),score=161.27 TRINITY_DN6621_c0_g2_i1:122-1597(+)
MSWLTTAKNVVSGSLKKPESPAPDEGFDRTLRIFLSLGEGVNKVQSSARESLLGFQKMCVNNKDLAGVISQQSSASKASGCDLRSAADQFSFVNATLTTTYLNDLVGSLQSTVLKPLARDKDQDADTKAILEERKRLLAEVEGARRGGEQRLLDAQGRAKTASERAIEHLTVRNKQRAQLILRSLSSLVEAQRAFFGAAFTLYSDVLELSSEPVAAPAPSRPPSRVEEASFVSFEDEQPRTASLASSASPTPPPPLAASSDAAFVSFEDDHPAATAPSPSVEALATEESPLADFGSPPTSAPASAASAASELLMFEADAPAARPAAAAPAPAVDPFRVFDNLPRNEKEVTEESRHKLKPLPADPELVRERQEAVLSRMAANDAVEQNEKDERLRHDEEITQTVEAWSAGKSGNLRALLASLHTVLWEDCGWKEHSLSDLIQPNKVKLAYRKALMVLHPDKMTDQPLERRLLAERVFSVLHDTYEPLKGELG